MNNSNGVKMDSNTQDNTNIESSQNVAKTPVVKQIKESRIQDNLSCSAKRNIS